MHAGHGPRARDDYPAWRDLLPGSCLTERRSLHLLCSRYHLLHTCCTRTVLLQPGYETWHFTSLRDIHRQCPFDKMADQAVLNKLVYSNALPKSVTLLMESRGSGLVNTLGVFKGQPKV